ncbi:MAG TPA: autotransporter-associated beta strand repeat-containing protein, partial [Pirellulales bacterium]
TTPVLTVSGTTGMSFAATNGASLAFTLNGSSNSSITVTNALSFGLTSGVDIINISGTAADKTYVLMNFGSENVVGGEFQLGSHPADLNTYKLENTVTQELLVVAPTTAPTAAYWSGARDANWNTVSGSSTNWVNGPTGTDTNQLPGIGSDVYFTANAAANYATTTLGQSFEINSLTLGTGVDTAGSIIASGAGGPYTLTIDASAGAYAAGTGLTVVGGTNTISANVALGGSLTNQTWNLASGSSLNVSGNISEVNAGTTLTVNTSGSGTLSLTGNNSYTGGTTINGGTVQINSNTSLGIGGTATINAGTLEATASISTARSFVLGDPGSTILVDGGQTYAITNTAGSGISGSGTLNATGVGILALDDTLNANTFTGGSVISGGTVQIFTGTSLGDVSGAATINAGTLEAMASISTTRSFALGDPGSTISVDGGQTYSIANSGTSGISGSGTLNATGAGILALDDRLNANTFTGGSVISGGGTVEIYTASSLGAATGTAALSGGTLEAMQSITTSRGFTLTGASNYISVAGTPTTTLYEIDGTISNGASTGTLNVNGTGTLVLTGTNGYTGNTFVTSGALDLDPIAGPGFSASGTGDVTLSGTGVLATTMGDTIAGNLNVGSGTTVVVGQGTGTPTLSINGATGLTLPTAGGATFDFNLNGAGNSSIVIANGQLNFGTSGTDTINVAGAQAAGTYVLMNFANGQTGTQSFALGTTPGGPDTYSLLDTGTKEELIVTSNAAPTAAYWSGAIDGNWNTLSGISTNWVNGPAGSDTNQLPGSTSDIYLTANSASNLSTALGQDFTINSLTFTGTGTANTAGFSIASGSGGPYTLTLDAASGAYTAGTGITILAGAGSDTISANVALGAGQTWNLASGTALTVSGAISETNSGTILTVAGSGTLALTGDNTYSGGTTINGGTVQIFTTSSLGASGTTATINAATLEAAATFTDSRSINLNNAAAAIMVDASQTYTLSGVLSGTGGLNVPGP